MVAIVAAVVVVETNRMDFVVADHNRKAAEIVEDVVHSCLLVVKEQSLVGENCSMVENCPMVESFVAVENIQVVHPNESLCLGMT